MLSQCCKQKIRAVFAVCDYYVCTICHRAIDPLDTRKNDESRQPEQIESIDKEA